MDYCRNLVVDYLRADRTLFLNEQCLIQLDPCRNPDDTKHWLADVVVADFHRRTVWLCEVTYEKSMSRLVKRLMSWRDNWEGVCDALHRDEAGCGLPKEWPVKLWVFVPQDAIPLLQKKLNGIGQEVKITPLEATMPWTYRDWDRDREEDLKE
jgi:hypothetical protein